ncbi:MAG: M20/M25/M40 family metallo-hydrolase [Clostridia bacterium]|nr:M20/M25/M40 family metallo-hydrolase [Clostridia bacterium]
MKYIGIALLAVLAVIVLLVVVAAIKAVKIKAKPNTNAPAINPTAEEADKYAKALSEMVKVPTISLRGNTDLTEFYNLHKVMEKNFPLIFSKLEKTEIEGNLLFRWAGKDPNRQGILLMGHQDVVTADEPNWEKDPFSGEICDGNIHGRGAMDCKSTVFSEFQAIEELLAEGFEPPCDIYLATAVDEEISGEGAPKLVSYLKSKGVRLDVAMDEGGAILKDQLPTMNGWCAAIGLLEKGYIDLKVIAKGKGGHSSTPRSNTPMARLAKFVADVEKDKPFKAEISGAVYAMLDEAAPYLGFPLRMVLGNMWLFKGLLTKVLPMVSPMCNAFVRTTFCCTMAEGSHTPNVIPSEAYVVCNLRTAPHQNVEESLAVLKKYADKYDLEFEIIHARDASSTVDYKGEAFGYLKKCLNECYPDASVIPYLMTGGTDCRHYEEVADNCLRFCPIKMSNAQLAAMHAANESIGVKEVADCVKFYKYYIKNHK